MSRESISFEEFIGTLAQIALQDSEVDEIEKEKEETTTN